MDDIEKRIQAGKAAYYDQQAQDKQTAELAKKNRDHQRRTEIDAKKKELAKLLPRIEQLLQDPRLSKVLFEAWRAFHDQNPAEQPKKNLLQRVSIIKPKEVTIEDVISITKPRIFDPAQGIEIPYIEGLISCRNLPLSICISTTKQAQHPITIEFFVVGSDRGPEFTDVEKLIERIINVIVKYETEEKHKYDVGGSPYRYQSSRDFQQLLDKMFGTFKRVDDNDNDYYRVGYT